MKVHCDELLAILKPQLLARNILFVGCASGEWVEQIARIKIGYCTGIDPNLELIERARLHAPERCIFEHVPNMAKIPFDTNNVFDTVIVSLLWGSWTFNASVAKELLRLLKRNGHVFVLAPSYAGNLNQAKTFFGTDAVADHKERLLATLYILGFEPTLRSANPATETFTHILQFTDGQDIIDTFRPTKELSAVGSILRQWRHGLASTDKVDHFVRRF